MRKGDENHAYPHKLARLAKHVNNLTKRWFVVYYAWSEIKQKLVRKRMEINGATLEIRTFMPMLSRLPAQMLCRWLIGGTC